jgi:integrase/recombinase XerD
MPLKLVRRKGSDHIYLRGTVAGQPVFESTKTDNESIAEAIRIKREAELLEASVFGKKAIVTFFEAAVAYLEAGGSPRFLGTEVNGRWTGLMGHFEKAKLHTIGQSELDRAAEKLYPGTSYQTRNRQCYTPFIAVWNHAVKNNWADKRDWSRPKKPKGTLYRARPTRAGTRPVSYERAAQFVLAMSPAPAYVLTVLFYTGMRPIELFALGAADFNIPGRWIALGSSKTDEPRGIPIHEFLVPLLTPLVERGDPLFRTPAGARLSGDRPGRRDQRSDPDGNHGRAQAHWHHGHQLLHGAPHGFNAARHQRHPPVHQGSDHGPCADDMSRRYTHVPQQPLIDVINTLPVIPAWRDAPWMKDPLKYARNRVETVTPRETNVESNSAASCAKSVQRQFYGKEAVE